ncbi:hypothetical protein ACUH97_06235 [Dermabacteraceae bacterium P13088]
MTAVNESHHNNPNPLGKLTFKDIKKSVTHAVIPIGIFTLVAILLGYLLPFSPHWLASFLYTTLDSSDMGILVTSMIPIIILFLPPLKGPQTQPKGHVYDLAISGTRWTLWIFATKAALGCYLVTYQVLLKLLEPCFQNNKSVFPWVPEGNNIFHSAPKIEDLLGATVINGIICVILLSVYVYISNLKPASNSTN